MWRFLKFSIVVFLLATPLTAGPLGLGRLALSEEISAWDIDVRPDGAGLPDGSGSATDGEEIFAEKCAACHGDFGEGVGRWPALAGGEGTLTDERPSKTVGSYWPYLSTVWDYIYRTMPYGDARSLRADEVYQLVAYILYLNDLVEDDFILSKANFTSSALPNEYAFKPDDRPESEYPEFRSPACMQNCKSDPVITAVGTAEGEDIGG